MLLRATAALCGDVGHPDIYGVVVSAARVLPSVDAHVSTKGVCVVDAKGGFVGSASQAVLHRWSCLEELHFDVVFEVGYIILLRLACRRQLNVLGRRNEAVRSHHACRCSDTPGAPMPGICPAALRVAFPGMH